MMKSGDEWKIANRIPVLLSLPEAHFEFLLKSPAVLGIIKFEIGFQFPC